MKSMKSVLDGPDFGCGSLRVGERALEPAYVSMSARLAGSVAYVELHQVFINPCRGPLNAVYAFPLPPGAAVHRFEWHHGGAPQRTPSPLRAAREERRQAFEVPVGTLPKGRALHVALAYATELSWRDGQLEFRLRRPEGGAGCSLGLVVELDGLTLSPSNLVSGSHELRPLEPAGPKLTWAPGRDRSFVRDFVLRFQPGQSWPQPHLLSHQGHFLLSLPPLAPDLPCGSRDVVVLVDQSRISLDDIREAVSAYLKHLRAGDHVSLCAFSDRPGQFHRCDLPGPGALLCWVGTLPPGAGGDLHALLRAGLARAVDSGRHVSVLLISGGPVRSEQEAYLALGRLESPPRVFTLGVGPAAHQTFLRRLAHLGRGACEWVGPGGSVARAADRLASQDGAPVLVDLRLIDRGFGLAAGPPPPCELYEGRSESAYGRHKGGRGLELAGRWAGCPHGSWHAILKVLPTDNPALPLLWARARIEELERQLLLGGSASHLEHLLDLEQSYSLLARSTAFGWLDEVRARLRRSSRSCWCRSPG